MSKPILPPDAVFFEWQRKVDTRLLALERGRRTPGITATGPDGIQVVELAVPVTPTPLSAYDSTPNLVFGGTPIAIQRVTFRVSSSGRAALFYGAQWSAGFSGTQGRLGFSLDGDAYTVGSATALDRDVAITLISTNIDGAPLARFNLLTGLAEGQHTADLLFYASGGGGGSPPSFNQAILIAIPL